jgi:hypothetical protein
LPLAAKLQPPVSSSHLCELINIGWRHLPPGGTICRPSSQRALS